MYYNHWWPKRRDYVEETSAPLYAFGYGLSYTTFDYADLKISQSGNAANTTIEVSVEITNTGDRDGDEVVQLYVRDVVSSVVTSVKQLRGFERIHLAKGESKTVTFTLTPAELAFLLGHGSAVRPLDRVRLEELARQFPDQGRDE